MDNCNDYLPGFILIFQVTAAIMNILGTCQSLKHIRHDQKTVFNGKFDSNWSGSFRVNNHMHNPHSKAIMTYWR